MKMASMQARNHQNHSFLGFIVLFSNAKLKAPLEVSRKQHRKWFWNNNDNNNMQFRCPDAIRAEDGELQSCLEWPNYYQRPNEAI